MGLLSRNHPFLPRDARSASAALLSYVVRPGRLQFEGTAAILDHHDSSVAAWLSLTGAPHGCVYDRTAAYYSGEGYSKVKSARKATGNYLGYFPRHGMELEIKDTDNGVNDP